MDNDTRKKAESTQIKKFISNISAEKYAEADKYLRAVIDSKIEKQIDDTLEKPLF